MRERKFLREILFKSRRKKEQFEKVLVTRNFAGIPEDTKENIGIERRFGGLVHIRGLAQQYKGESESWWLLLRCEA